MTLREIIQQKKGQLMGEKVYAAFGENFPLLIKFIDANLPLSIQVHPGDVIAKERHQSFGKNEMWYVMDADQDAQLIVGFNQVVTPIQYQSKLQEGKILEILNIEKVNKEDVFYIPEGRVHAIGAGVLLAEIQQTSDVTYRIFDYNRIDAATGKERALHNDLALDVIDFNLYPTYKTEYEKKENESNKLIHTTYFSTNFIRFIGSSTKNYQLLDSFVIYICVAGAMELNVENKIYSLQKGETILFPASTELIAVNAKNGADVLEVYL
jgi:mannose-6-phosphate isomerase